METLWFILVLGMLAAYVVLDGFDLGAGIIKPLIARNDNEHRLVLRAIGPVWSGNEVWLLAAGGALFFAFPRTYASSFSGFYLSLMMVLWLLMLRGIGVEMRSHVKDPLWWSFCDFVFSAASLLLAVFYGVAIGNVIRGVPLDASGYFFEPLWTDFTIGPEAGILDWYTLLTGALALATLTVHGAHYVALKTEGDVNARARRVARACWFALAVLTVASFVATLFIRERVTEHFLSAPWGWILAAFIVAPLGLMGYYRARGRDLAAFLASSAYIALLFVGAGFAMYPDLLPATTDPAFSLTVHNTKTGAYSLQVGLIWWLVGTALAVVYFTFLYRSFRGKVTLDGDGY